MPLLVSQLDSPLGPLFVVATRDGVCLLEFADRPGIAAQAESVRRCFRADIVPGTNRHVARLARELKRYFAGELTRFTVPLAIAGTPFQLRHWEALRSIPMGTTRTYGQLARDLQCPAGPRAVGRANGQNRIAILIPCHRVVESDGSLCGYGGGLWRKRSLLELERRAAASASATRSRALRRALAPAASDSTPRRSSASSRRRPGS